MNWILSFMMIWVLLAACTSDLSQTAEPAEETKQGEASELPSANLPNPAAVFCTEQGYQTEIRTAEDGSQAGYCIFPDGSECDEWAFYRGECASASQDEPTAAPAAPVEPIIPAATDFPTPLPIDPADYQDWWTYAHPVDNFSIRLPEDWIVEEVTTGDSTQDGHVLNLRPEYAAGKENIRLTFRRLGEEVRLWPTGVGQGEFIENGTLEVAGSPAQRMLLVCPTGEVTSIWYHQGEGQPNLVRGDLEFGFLFSVGSHCEAGQSLGGKVQRWGEMIIASLKVP